MNPGPPRGETETTTLQITDDMVDPGTSNGHAVCSLDAMVAAMGRASRALILPHLGEDEIIVSDQATFVWRAPVPVGCDVEQEVTVAQVSRKDVMSEVVVRRDSRMVARGTHTMRIVTAAAFRTEVDEAG